MREKGEANAGEEIGTTNTIYGAVTANTIRQNGNENEWMR